MADLILVEAEEVLRRTLARALEDEGHSVRPVESGHAALDALAVGPPDLLLADHRASGADADAGELLAQLRSSHPDVPVVVLATHGTIDDALAAVRDGAADYLRKPIDLKELSLVVHRCLERESLRKELDYYRTRDLGEAGRVEIIGDSAAIRQLRSLIGRLARLEKRDGAGPTILLAGEPGTGKAMAARAIHKSSPRAKAPFIEVSCTAIPDNLLEADLMGYEKGAFSDAAQARAGLFETAEGGTIFFDEIGHVGRPLQARILKAINDHTVCRLGSTRDRAVRCTIVAATRMNLGDKVAAGELLEELYHRISVVRIDLPPLRERDDDILALAEHFVRAHASDYGIDPTPRLTARAGAAIRSYTWPGNVRELGHAIEHALVMNPGELIDDHHLSLHDEGTAMKRMNITRVDDLEVDFSEGAIRLEDVEVSLIKRAMEFTRGNQVRSAKLLGLSRDALRYRLEKYKLR